MKLFFDTETTGVPKNYKAPITDTENWPRLVQLGYIVYDELNGGECVEYCSMEHIIKPEGFVIPAEVSKIHGITQEQAMEEGENLANVVHEFLRWVNAADELVGHNLSYDLHIMGAECIRLQLADPFVGKSTYDTMLKGTGVCKIPGFRMGEYKWPKLHELYYKLFNTPLVQTHTALDDIRNTSRCYFELKRLGV
jgi:DNA polymerase III subunit epsilon